ncbi:MFS transporter [Hamadaea tsunoensis]|uniref:MFS transporter n=1 Tax=Hamadaea tsunoensis TaxID=53368 RepID=UPI00041BF43D|nr:MFS transporter [Hamadaea tsunoensis]
MTMLQEVTTPVTPAAKAPWRALPVLLLGAFLPMLDAFIVNIALATIGRTLAAGPAALELTVSGYGVAYACTLVAGGRLGDRFGRRRLFLIGLAAFVITSAACGLAPTVGVLIAFRVLQGFAAAMLYPQVLASIQAGFTGPDRARALGFFGAIAGIASAAGQLLGGALLAADVAGLSWRPIFLVNVPIGVLALILAARLIPETRSTSHARVDTLGAVVLALAIAFLLVPLTLGRAAGWPVWTWVSLGLVVPALYCFHLIQVRVERRSGDPLLPPSLLRLPLARRALVAITLFAVLIGGFLFTTSITMQVAHDFGPFVAGLTMAPCATVFLLASLRVGGWVARWGVRVLAIGALLFAAGLSGFAAAVAVLGDRLTAVWIAVPLVVVGLGWAMVLVPLIGSVLAGLPADRAGLAGGVLSTAMQIGLALGASVLGSALFGLADAFSWRVATVGALGCCVALALATAYAVTRLRPS